MNTVYIVIPLLLIGVVLAAVWLERWSVPVILVALGLGIVFGSDVLNHWHFLVRLNHPPLRSEVRPGGTRVWPMLGKVPYGQAPPEHLWS